MHGNIGAHFRMESGGQGLPFPHEHGVIAFRSQHFDAFAHVNNFRSADEDHLEGRIAEASLPDGAFELPSIGIAADADIERIQTGLRRILHFAGEKDASGTGSEDGLRGNKLLQLRQPFFAEELEECTRFSSRNDEAVDSSKLVRIADEGDSHAKLFEADTVGVKISLQRQDSDFHAALILMDRGLPRAAVPV